MTGPTTDFAVIEAQKENIRPAASGRSAATLSVLLDKGPAVDAKVQETYEQFRKEIEEAERRDKEGDEMQDGYQDLLDVYFKCVEEKLGEGCRRADGQVCGV
jgi:checkpoint serine/threonine-protein kinase